MEYPNYGIYRADTCQIERVLSNALQLYDYVVQWLNFVPKNIILVGRSIGSGAATYVASRRSPGCLALISPFASLRQIVSDIAGHYLQYLVRERMNNVE